MDSEHQEQATPEVEEVAVVEELGGLEVQALVLEELEVLV
jgi:hypothetical protein